jgi:hypothetical protein
MLGREYTILGTVVHGDDLGKKIGFPTANLSAHSEQFPPNGVYFAEAKLDGYVYPGVGESRLSAHDEQRQIGPHPRSLPPRFQSRRFTAKILSCASSVISGRRRNSRTLMR